MADNLLNCPVRGKLNSKMLAKDGLRITEEARRIDFLLFILSRGYPKSHIDVETVVVKNLGESGRNTLRADVIVYDMPVKLVDNLPIRERLKKAVLVAEIKRDSSKKVSGVACQLEPAMAQLPGIQVMGAYWDDVARLLFIKKIVKKDENEFVEILEESLEHLPRFGVKFKAKPITIADLSSPANLVAVLFNVANVMRSHGINDEHLRYKETVKLILARYCDERAATNSKDKSLALQVYPGNDFEFLERVTRIYEVAAKRYKQAKTLFRPVPGSELSERTLKEVIKLIQGIAFEQAGNEVMQQVFLSFVPAVFKKNLDQYFTPLTLIDAMIEFVQIGPNEKVADPAMGTADFLSATMEFRQRKGDQDTHQRVFGMDVDAKAYDLAVINMILNRDGQSNLVNVDAIEDHVRWFEEMDVALCNPPFGEKSVETRPSVLSHYDLGHQWNADAKGKWTKGKALLTSQQLGLLFIERCYKMLGDGGRLAIILPEGYLCTTSYGYVRQWLIDHFRIVCLVELPRRIFLKSNADLRSNVLVAQKLSPKALKEAIGGDYPIYTDLVRKVGYKLGSGYAPIAKADIETGDPIRDENNRLVLDSDFTGIKDRFRAFTRQSKWQLTAKKRSSDMSGYLGGKISDVMNHPDLDMKPRRLTANALENKRRIQSGEHVRLGDIVDIVSDTSDILKDGVGQLWRLVEGMDIRANEGVVVPQFPARHWQIAEKKGKLVYKLSKGDIIVGLVRPERRNIGMLVFAGDDIVGSPDGIAVVRVKTKFAKKYPQEWLFAELRSERSRLQLWTESGGTSYGKLSSSHIASVLLAVPSKGEISVVASSVKDWSDSLAKGFSRWETIGRPEDRRPIINSAIIGLESDDLSLEDS